MTTLTEKFTALEADLSAQNEAVLAALAALSTIDSGVENLVTLNSDLGVNFTAFASSLLSNLETMSVNQTNGFRNVVNAVNTLFCPCDTNGPLIPVPPTTGPTPNDKGVLCQRIQYFIDLFRLGVIVSECVYVDSAGIMSGISAKILQDNALADVSIITGEIYAGMPTAVQSGVASAWNNLIAAYGPHIAQGAVFDVAANLSEWNSIRDALSGASSATDGYVNLVAAIAATDWQDGVKAIISASFYSAWLNDIYSDVPVVDDSGYSDTACSFLPAVCSTWVSVPVSDDRGHNYWAIDVTIPFANLYLTVNSSTGNVTTDVAVTSDGDYFGWTMVGLTGTMYCQHRPGGITDGSLFAIQDITSVPFTAPHTGTVQIASTGGPFSISICPPGVGGPS